MTPQIGDQAPGFELPDTDGTGCAVPDGAASATVVVFTCNHCPYALAWHERILDVARDYSDRGVRLLAINSNDAARYPRDSLQAMRVASPGFSTEGVLTTSVDLFAAGYDALRAKTFQDELLDRLQGLGGVGSRFLGFFG